MVEVRFHRDIWIVEPSNFIHGCEMQEWKGAMSVRRGCRPVRLGQLELIALITNPSNEG